MSISRYLQVALFGGAFLGLAACSGGSSSVPIAGTPGNGVNNNVVCYADTQVQLANPLNGNVNVPTNVGQVYIVANGNNNSLNQSYTQGALNLQDNFGNIFPGGALNLVPFKNGPTPYTSDFYYASSVPTLPAGRTYNVYLNQNTSNCAQGLVGSFST